MQNTIGTSYSTRFPRYNQLTREICKTPSTQKISRLQKAHGKEKKTRDYYGQTVGPQYVQTRSYTPLQRKHFFLRRVLCGFSIRCSYSLICMCYCRGGVNVVSGNFINNNSYGSIHENGGHSLCSADDWRRRGENFRL